MILLAIETSCDETGVGVIKFSTETTKCQPSVSFLANEVYSSKNEHENFGGIMPEIASRAHLKSINLIVSRALQSAKIKKPDIVAATAGPGLKGSLAIGLSAAKTYAIGWGVPFYGVNHLGSHLAADINENGPLSESIGLLVSGGHTHLVYIKTLGTPIVELGSTVDDAAGEAYDKVARLLELKFANGTILDRLARKGKCNFINFPRAMTIHKKDQYKFSFSGIKTSVAYCLEQNRHISKANIAASFQEAIADVLISKALQAASDLNVSTLIIAGGVAANSRLRELAEERCYLEGIKLRTPNPQLCTDNGVMVASFASHLIAAGALPSKFNTISNPCISIAKSQINLN